MAESPRICGYCDQPITDSAYIMQYFPDDKIHKPVHNHHLSVTKGEPHKIHNPFEKKGKK